MKNIWIVLPLLAVLVLFGSEAFADEPEAGTVLTVNKDVTLFHAGLRNEARPRDPLFPQDAVETGNGSRAKLFFRDDSVLNLGQQSRLEVAQYLQSSATDRSRAVYNLLDGSLKAVVGRSDLEIHTPTAVAAARGTKFFMAVQGSGAARETLIIVLEGEVTARSIVKEILEVVTLRQGQMTRVRAGLPPEPASPSPPRLLNQYRTGTLALGQVFQDRLDALALPLTGEGAEADGRPSGEVRQAVPEGTDRRDSTPDRAVWDNMKNLGQPPIAQEPLRALGDGFTPVNVNIDFPEGR